METGIFTEFQCPPGMTEARAFEESMAQMRAAEELGYDCAWLAEIHFQKDRSVLASPLVIAAAITAQTRRIRVGIAVQVLWLGHPLRIAEDVATVDQLSQGRLEFGIGRSGLPAHYRGFNVSPAESRERFFETLDILMKAWTQERFSHEGKFWRFDDVCIMPKPYQKPHPPIRMAATSQETFSIVGQRGLPLFVTPRTTSILDVMSFIPRYEEGWNAGGHAGRGPISIILPIYVGKTTAQARDEAAASTMHFYRSISRALAMPDGSTGPAAAARAERARVLGALSYDDVLREYVVSGTPEEVVDRIAELRERIGFSSVSAAMNMGGQISHEHVLGSMKLFAERVIPKLAA